MSDAHMVAAGQSQYFSPDYLHFHAAVRCNVSLNASVTTHAMWEALRLDGQPYEHACPYSELRAESWKPPSGIAPLWISKAIPSPGLATAVLISALQAGRAAVLVLRISRSFHLPNPSTHVVTEDGGADQRFHAVIPVGTGTIGGETMFLVRNSWGKQWGLKGHAWLPASYIDSRADSIHRLELL